MSKIVRVSETFTIRKIDPKQIASRFFKGEYTGRNIPETKIKSTASLLTGKEIGTDSLSEVFRFKDKNNNNQTIYTTNHSLYKHVLDIQNGKNTEIPILKCKYCKRGNLKKPIGLPMYMETSPNDVAFFVTDSFCDFGCAFSYLKRKLGESRIFKNPLYMNSEQLLYCFYYRVHPQFIGQTIREKPDWELLRENGGSLTNEEFDSESVEYIPLPSVVLLPSKKQYIKMNLR